MKLKYTFENVEMDGEIIAVPIEDSAEEMHGVLRLNGGASEILNLLKKDTTEENVVSALAEQYENNRDEITVYVHEFVNKLWEMNLLEE